MLPPPTRTHGQQASSSAATGANAGPRPKYLGPLKAHDPYKQHRKYQHQHTVTTTTDKRRQLGLARAVARLQTIPEHHEPTNQKLPNNNWPQIRPFTHEVDPHHLRHITPKKTIFKTPRGVDGDLELSEVQLSVTKEALEDPSEEENQSKRSRTANPNPVETNEGDN